MALSDNLISYWKLDESSGNAADSHGSNTLTNGGSAASRVAGKINNGVDLEKSSSQYLTIADASQSGLDFSDILTFAGWINFESVTSGDDNPLIVKRVGTGNQRSYTFTLSGPSTFALITYTDGSSIGCNVSVSWTPSTATWYHVAVTKSGTTVKFYVNGAQQGTDQTGSNGTIYNGTAPFELGGFASSPAYFDGIMDEWGVWSRALSGAEIAEIYNSGSGLPYPFATDVTVSPSVLTATLSIPAATVSTVQNVTVSPSALSFTASIPAATAITDAVNTPNALSAAFSLPEVGILIADTTVTPSALSAAVSIPSVAVSTDQTLTPSPFTATYSLPSATVETVQNATCTPSPLSASFSILAAVATGALWENQDRASAASLTNQSRTSSTWTNQDRSPS